MIFLSDAENRTIVPVSSFAWTKHRNVTDRRTDGRTESIWLNSSRAVKILRFANVKSLN